MRPKSLFLFLALIIFSHNSTFGQNKNTSPYKTDLLKDGIFITTGVGLNVLGLSFVQNKDALTLDELNAKSKNDIWKVDRWAAGNYSNQANKDSYIPLYASLILPFTLMINQDERHHAGQISVLFLETMATTGALFTLSAGLVEKSRPLVYNTNLSDEKRIAKDEQRSFFAGHTAATAAATFFAAKVYSDFHPDSNLKPLVWGVAAAIPASVGYLRVRAGKHFLTDNLIGYAVGAASGILIPELHKRKNDNLTIYPTIGLNPGGLNSNYQGLGMNYSF